MDEDVAKGLCIFFLFIDTIIFGWPPFFLVRGQAMSERALQIKATVISYLNCFAGGVFMGACLIHMLAEGREEMMDYFERVDYDADYPFYETLTALGFFFIAAVEITAHKFLHKDNDQEGHGQLHQEEDRKPTSSTLSVVDRSSFPTDGPNIEMNSMAGKPGPWILSATEISKSSQQENSKNGLDNPNYIPGEDGIRSSEQLRPTALDSEHQGKSVVPEFSDTTKYQIQRKDSTGSHDSRQHGHGGEMATAMKSMESDPLRAFLLLAALSFHTVFDGLAVGLTDSTSDVWQMFAAICIHKTLVAFCLGTQLFMAFKEKPIKAFMWIFIFSLIAPIGVGIGMYLTSGHGDDLAKDLTSWILQGLATGTFLYVTFFEILRYDLMENSGILKLLAVIVGFGGMAAAKLMDAD